MSEKPKTLRVCNLFPRLIGSFANMTRLLPHIADLGFNVVWLQPFWKASQLPSPWLRKTGSCYAIQSYSEIDSRHRTDRAGNQFEDVKAFTSAARALGLLPVADLVVHHVAHDHQWVSEDMGKRRFRYLDRDIIRNHPTDVYPHGQLVGPLVIPAGGLSPFPEKDPALGSCWDDVAHFNYERTDTFSEMIEEWKRLIDLHLDLGFSGFRCDCASLVPRQLWAILIDYANHRSPEQLVWIAETVGAPWDAIVRTLSGLNFDAVTNSVFFWNGADDYFYRELGMFRHVAPSIGFVGSHDTPWHTEFLSNCDIRIELARRYAIALFLSDGIIMPYGFEFGMNIRLSVFNTEPKDLDKKFDISPFVREFNSAHAKLTEKLCRVTEWDRRLAGDQEHPDLIVFVWSYSKDNAIIILVDCQLRDENHLDAYCRRFFPKSETLIRTEKVRGLSVSETDMVAANRFIPLHLETYDPNRIMQFVAK